MNSTSEINLGLFALLEYAPLHEMIAGKKQDDKKQAIALTVAGDNLFVFIKNFFIQLFFEGYGFVILGFHTAMLLELEQLFRRQSLQASKIGKEYLIPNEMIEAINEYLRIDRDVVAGPYTKEVGPLKGLYCSFLPRLFEAFNRDGISAIKNYSDVKRRIDETLKVINRVCA